MAGESEEHPKQYTSLKVIYHFEGDNLPKAGMPTLVQQLLRRIGHLNASMWASDQAGHGVLLPEYICRYLRSEAVRPWAIGRPCMVAATKAAVNETPAPIRLSVEAGGCVV